MTRLLQHSIFMMSIFVVVALSGCSTTISRSKLKTDWKLTEQSDVFHKKSGLDRYKVVFTYNVDTGAIAIQNVDPKTLTPGYFRSLYQNNEYSIKRAKTVSDCITVRYGKYSPTNEAAFSACPGTEYDFDWTLFRKAGDHKDFGPAVIAALNDSVSSSCTVLDPKINVWYGGECLNHRANGQGIAVGRDKYIGNFTDGKKDGKGEYFGDDDNSHYEGDFVDDQMTGKGTLTWHDIELQRSKTYVGDFVNGNRTGNGELKYNDANGKLIVLTGFFLNNKYFSNEDLHAYKMQNDKEYAKNYNLDRYRQAYSSANNSSDLRNFISQYQSNDVDGLIPQAKIKLSDAVKRENANAKERKLQEYRDSYKNAHNSYEYSQFILTYSKNDPEKLVAKAKIAKAAALKSEKQNYDSVSSRGWSPNYKVKVTFKTSSGKAIDQLQKVVAAVKVRDPSGFFNPYWVPTFHASAAYDDKGVVVGEWYTSYYEGMGDWSRYLQREMDKLNIKDWNIAALGETSRPQSNYGTSAPSSVTGNSSASSSSPKASYKCDNNGGPSDSRLLAVCSDGHKYNIYCWTSGAYTGQCDTQAFSGKYSYSYVMENTCKNRGGLTCLEKR